MFTCIEFLLNCMYSCIYILYWWANQTKRVFGFFFFTCPKNNDAQKTANTSQILCYDELMTVFKVTITDGSRCKALKYSRRNVSTYHVWYEKPSRARSAKRLIVNMGLNYPVRRIWCLVLKTAVIKNKNGSTLFSRVDTRVWYIGKKKLHSTAVRNRDEVIVDSERG